MREIARPAVGAEREPTWAAHAVASARAAALADPEGEALDKAMAELAEAPALAAE